MLMVQVTQITLAIDGNKIIVGTPDEDDAGGFGKAYIYDISTFASYSA